MCVMNLNKCGAMLSVLGVGAAIAVFATQTSTGSALPPANGMTLASVRGAEVAPAQANPTAPAVVNLNDWQETAIRRGSVRRL